MHLPKSLIPLGDVGYMNHTSFISIKDQIFRDYSPWDLLKPFYNIFLGLPFSFVIGLKFVQSTFLICTSTGLLCMCLNHLNHFFIICSSINDTPNLLVYNHFISCPFLCGHASIWTFSFLLFPPFFSYYSYKA